MDEKPTKPPIIAPASQGLSSTGESLLEPSPKKSPLIFILSALLVLAIGTAAYFSLQSRQSPPVAQPHPTASAIASASADPTADWQTYTDKTHNFTLQYQPDDNLKQVLCPSKGLRSERFVIYTLSEDTPTTDPAYQCDTQGEDHTITITTTEYAGNCQTTESWRGVESSILVGDTKAMMCKSTFVGESLYPGPGERTKATIPSGDQYIHIEIKGSEYIDTFTQILSTFQFTDLATTISTWEEYSNTSPNYTISYPQDWSVEFNNDGGHRLTLTKGEYKIIANWPDAFGPGICIFDDQNRDGAPMMASFCEGEFTTIGQSTIMRRLVEPVIRDTTASWTVYSNDDGNWVTMIPISYQAPKNYDYAVIQEMDAIIETLTN